MPAERTTTYGVTRVFRDPAQDPTDPLDVVEYDDKRFGTYKVLVQLEDWRFKDSFESVGGKSGKS
ncbi:MAG: hypothetical protein WEB04_08870 [Dehalococcoidia bacterium]